MARALLVLANDRFKQRAIEWITKAPYETRVEFKASKRSLPQNDLMWALLTEFAQKYAHNAKDVYRRLWEWINGEESWPSNPWVIAYTFTVDKRNIDQIARAA